MVYRKRKPSKKVKFVKKRTFRKKEERPKNSVNVGLGFPKMMVVKQKYCDDFQLTSETGFMDTHQFILNGLYDPDATNGLSSHQPMYFDQYMAIYNHFTVIGCKMTVTFTPHEANLVPVRVCLFQNDDTTITPVSINELQEQSKAKGFTIGSGGDSRKTLTLNWSAKKTYGPPMANTLLRGNINANPQETTVGTIAIQSTDSSNPCYVSCTVSLEFITVYSELRDLAGS